MPGTGILQRVKSELFFKCQTLAGVVDLKSVANIWKWMEMVHLAWQVQYFCILDQDRYSDRQLDTKKGRLTDR